MIVGDMEIRLRADIARLQRDMDSARRVVGDATAGISRAAELAKAALASIGLGVGLSQIIQMSDQYAKFTAQLRLAAQSSREYAKSYEDVRHIAAASQQDLASTGVLYARIANGTRELGIAQKQVAAITETVNMALKVSGATAAESASAQLQLSQAFASGTLRGEEFNAVNEAAPRLMLALAEGIGVPVGALKKMAEEGLITSKIMADVLPKALEKLREESKEVQTISGAFTVLKNNLMEFVGIQSNASGAVSVLTGGIGLLANNLGLLAGAVSTLIAAKFTTWLTGIVTQTYASITANRALLASNLATAQSHATAAAAAAVLTTTRVAELRAAVLAAEGEVALAITLNGLVPAQARATVAAETHAASLIALSTAQKAASVTSGLASGALGLLGGPVGWITTLLGLGVTAWMLWGKSAKDSATMAAQSVEEKGQELIASLKRQEDQYNKVNAAKSAGLTLDQANKALPVIDQLKDYSSQIAQINKGDGKFGQMNNDEKFFEREKILNKIIELNKQVTSTESAGVEAGKRSINERVAAWKKEHATKQEQMAAELAGIADLKGKTSEYEVMVKRIQDKYAEKDKSAAAIHKEASAYAALITTIGEKIAAGKLEMSGYDRLSESQKLTIKLDEAIKTGKQELTPAHIANAKALIAERAAQEAVIAANKQAIADVEARVALRNTEQAGIDSYFQVQQEGYNAAVRGSNDALKAAQAEHDQFGMSKSRIAEITLLKLESTKASYLEGSAGAIAAQQQIDAQNELIGVLKKTEVKEDYKKIFDSIDSTAHDTFISIFDSGKSAFDRLRDTLKNGLLDLLYQMTIKKWIFNIGASVTGGGVSGVANAATGGGMDMLSTGKTLWDGFSGGMASSMGTTIASAGSALGMSAVSAFGTGMTMSTASAAAATATGAVGAGVGVTGTVATAMSAGASVAAAIPYVAAALAVAYVLKKGFGHGERETTSRGIEGSFGGSGFTGNNFANWKEEGGWFTGDNNGRDTSALDSATAKSFNNGYASLQASSINAAKALGLSAASISSYSEKISITLTDDAAKNSEIITKIFTDLGNNLAAAVAPSIAGFAKEGEAASATLSRLSGSITTANAWLSVLRQRLFQASLAGGDAASKLADAFGGLENLTAASKAFYDTYYTEGERATRSADDMAKALALVNLSMPATKDQLRSLATSLDLNTISGRAAYATLLAIAPEFASVADITAKLAKETADRLISTFTGGGLLMPALDAVFFKVGALTSGIGGLTGSLSDTQVRTLALATGLSDAQIRAGALTGGIGGLVGSLSDTQVRTLALATGLSDAQIRTGALTSGMGGLTGSMSETQVRTLALATGLSDAQIRTGALTSGMGGLTGSMSETQVRALALATGLSDAQIRAGALTGGIGGLVGSLSDTQVRTLALATGLSDAQIRAGALTSGMGGLVGSLSDTQVRAVALATGLSEAQIRAGALTSGMGGLTGSMTDTQVRALALATGLSEAQIRAGALTSGMGGLVGSLSDTQVCAVALATGLSEAQIRAGALTSGMGGLTGSMSDTQVRALALATGLNEAQIRTGALTGGMSSMGQAAGTVSTLFLDAKSGLISFGGGVSALQPTFTGAQLSAILLNNQIDSLRLGADRTRIDIAGLGAALAGVNTETFVSTIGLVFDNLATRIQGVIDGIGSERIAVREAALQIINPTVMSKAGIQKGLDGINTKLPSNAGVVSALNNLNSINAVQASIDSAKAGLTRAYAPIIDSSLALYNQSRNDSVNTLSAFKGLLGTYAKAGNYNTTEENFAAGTKFRAGGYYTSGGQTAQNNNTYAAYASQFDTAKGALATYTAYSNEYAKQMNLIAAWQADVTARANAAASAAKAAQLAYTDALQNFAIDASKSVGKLSKLREETVKYYDAQKQLADLMSNSAAGLRGTVADYKYNQLSAEQQFNDLQVKYATAYAMALSTDGETLAGYGDKLNSMLSPLLEKAKEVYGTDSAYNAFAATAFARAETIAGRLETLTPTNYAADSLLMLGQIDTTLAALDASSKSAEKLITDAIKAGSDKTAGGLRAVIAALTGQAIPGFATGGTHVGGLRIVGENGPELEATGPSRIFNASQTRNMLSGGGNAEVVAELRALRAEVSSLRAEARATAVNTSKLARQGDRAEQDGIIAVTDADFVAAYAGA